jgi:hypothetical protein
MILPWIQRYRIMRRALENEEIRARKSTATQPAAGNRRACYQSNSSENCYGWIQR